MSLRKTTLFIIAMTFVGLIVVLLGTLNAILPPYFQRQEQSNAILSAQRGISVFNAQLDELQRISQFWSSSAILSNNQTSSGQTSGISLPTDKIMSVLDIDLIVTFDARGQYQTGKLFSLDGQTSGKVPDDLVSQLTGIGSNSNSTSIQRGFLPTSTVPLMLVVAPSSGGTLLLGRYLDASVQQTLTDQLKLVVNIIPFNSYSANSDYSFVRSQLLASDQPVVQVVSTNLVAGYGLLKDPIGNSSYILEISQPRTFYQNSQVILNYLIISLVSSTAIFSLMTFLLIENVVLRRLSKLNKEVQSIALDGKSLTRVTITRKDELTDLSRNINQMLDRLGAAQAELEESYAQVRLGRNRLEDLSRRLVEVQEEERHSIAMELHDEVGQSLTALKLQLEASAAKPSAVRTSDLKNAQSLLNNLIERVRSLSLQLRPAMLDDLGLLPTLLWHFDQFEQQTRIKVDFQQSGLEKVRFPPALEVATYRIIQESLTNIARHAGADKAVVKVDRQPTLLHLEITDQGKGFNPEKALQNPNASGLSGMRERVTVLGGTLKIISQPKNGTTLLIDLPLNGHLERRSNARHHPARG
jgi:signal transduction histidine kinase